MPQLFAQTNDATNAVIHFVRNADGTLNPEGTVLTGGKGTNGDNYFMGNIVAPDAAVPDALPTQVAVTPNGKFVVVNGFLKTVAPAQPLNMLLSYPINSDGSLGQPVSSPSSGVGPFGGRFGSGPLTSMYAVTEAAGGTASSYSMAADGKFASLSGPIDVTGQQAPCWTSLTPDNRFAFVGNGSGAVSLFSIDTAGKLTLVNPIAATETPISGQTSAFANDSWISPDGKYLYQDYAGDDKIVAYAISADGSLRKLGEQPANTASKISLQGLAGT